MKLPYNLTLVVPNNDYFDMYVREIEKILRSQFVSYELYTYDFKISIQLLTTDVVMDTINRKLKQILGIEVLS